RGYFSAAAWRRDSQPSACDAEAAAPRRRQSARAAAARESPPRSPLRSSPCRPGSASPLSYHSVKRIVFHIGGPAFHPVDQQSREIVHWLGPEYECAMFDGVEAFEQLDRCDLLVLMGLHWTGGENYQRLRDRNK